MGFVMPSVRLQHEFASQLQRDVKNTRRLASPRHFCIFNRAISVIRLRTWRLGVCMCSWRRRQFMWCSASVNSVLGIPVFWLSAHSDMLWRVLDTDFLNLVCSSHNLQLCPIQSKVFFYSKIKQKVAGAQRRCLQCFNSQHASCDTSVRGLWVVTSQSYAIIPRACTFITDGAL